MSIKPPFIKYVRYDNDMNVVVVDFQGQLRMFRTPSEFVTLTHKTLDIKISHFGTSNIIDIHGKQIESTKPIFIESAFLSKEVKDFKPIVFQDSPTTLKLLSYDGTFTQVHLCESMKIYALGNIDDESLSVCTEDNLWKRIDIHTGKITSSEFALELPSSIKDLSIDKDCLQHFGENFFRREKILTVCRTPSLQSFYTHFQNLKSVSELFEYVEEAQQLGWRCVAFAKGMFTTLPESSLSTMLDIKRLHKKSFLKFNNFQFFDIDVPISVSEPILRQSLSSQYFDILRSASGNLHGFLYEDIEVNWTCLSDEKILRNFSSFETFTLPGTTNTLKTNA